MERSEVRGNQIAGAAGVVCFLKEYFDHIGKKHIAEYLATWPPYRIRCVHVDFIGPEVVPRPQLEPKSIPGTRDMYLFIGTNTARPEVPTTDVMAGGWLSSPYEGGNSISCTAVVVSSTLASIRYKYGVLGCHREVYSESCWGGGRGTGVGGGGRR